MNVKIILPIFLLAFTIFSHNPSMAETLDILSDTHIVDSLHKSMKGPRSSRTLTLLDTQEPELLWVTGYSSTMIEETEDSTQIAPEFLCHSNLRIIASTHSKDWRKKARTKRLFTLS